MRKRCVLALFAVVFWLSLATSTVGETRIEVDENGDEYELKRFFIQGRQLSGSGSKGQCVITRRKRSSRAVSGPSVTVSSQKVNFNAMPEHREGVQALPEQDNISSNKRRYVALAAVQELVDEEDDEEFDENVEDDEEQDSGAEPVQQTEQQKNQVRATYTVPLSQATPVAASHLSEGISVVASGATHANVVGNAGIVLVESDQPPKVNPNTHAVFELKPLKQKQKQQKQPRPQADFAYWPEDFEDEEDGDVDEDGDEFEGEGDVDEYFYYGPTDADLDYYEEQEHYITENSPVISSAIWSSDGEEEDADYNKLKKKKKSPANRRKPANKLKNKRKQQASSHKKRRPVQEQDQDMDVNEKPGTEQQIKRKKQQQTSVNSAASSSSAAADKPKPSRKPASSVSADSAPAKRKQQRRRPKPDQVQQKKKRRNRPSSTTNKRRRRPSSSSSSSSSLVPMGGYNRRRPLTQQEQKEKRRRLQQKRRRQEQQRRRRLRNKNRQQNGNDEFYGNEPVINCIYINKDPAPTTTTQRSVWNLLGRDANADGDSAAVDSAEPVTPNSLSESIADASADAESQSEQAPLQGIRRSGDFGHRKRTTLRFVGSQE